MEYSYDNEQIALREAVNGLLNRAYGGDRPALLAAGAVGPAEQTAHGLAEGCLLVVVVEVHGLTTPGSRER